MRLIIPQLLMLGIFFSCSSIPLSKSPETGVVKKAFSQLENEVSGNQSTGNIENIITESDELERKKYDTGKPGWIKVSGQRTFDESIAPIKAKQQLLQMLRNEAITKKLGTEIEITTLLSDVMSSENEESYEKSSWSGFFKSTVSGVITDEKVQDSMNPINNGYTLDMDLDAFVEPVNGQRDSGFFLEANLKSNMLKQGEELIINLKSSKNGYVYVLNLMADNNAMLMFPNDYMEENYLEAKKMIQIPDKKYRNKISFKVGVMPGYPITSETVYIVCTKEKVPMLEKLPKIGSSIKTLSKESNSFLELQKWLTKIPLNQRTEKALIYHVSF